MSTSCYSSFRGLDVRSIGAFRIALGITLLIDILLFKVPYLQLYYSNTGVFTSDMVLAISPEKVLSLLHLIKSSGGTIIFFSFTVIFLFLFMLGYKPLWTAALTYICFLSIVQRSSFTAGADMIFKLALFWSIFLPLGKKFTIFSKVKTSNSNNEIKNLASFAMLLQICIIYIVNALTKNGSLWFDGSASAYAAMIAVHKGPWADLIIASPFISSVLTYSTLVFEYGIPLLIFCPFHNNKTRIIAAGMIILFHWGNIPFLSVGSFGLATFPLAILLIPGVIWDKLKIKGIKINSNIIKNNLQLLAFKNTLIVIAIMIVLLINLETFLSHKVIPSKTRIKTLDYFGLFQRWHLFAPDPTKYNGYMILLGVLDNGSYINLYNNQIFNNNALNENPYIYNCLPYTMYFGSIYLRDLKNNDMGKLIGERWSRYEINKWNNNNSSLTIKSIYFGYVKFNSLSPGVVSAPKLELLYEYHL